VRPYTRKDFARGGQSWHFRRTRARVRASVAVFQCKNVFTTLLAEGSRCLHTRRLNTPRPTLY